MQHIHHHPFTLSLCAAVLSATPLLAQQLTPPAIASQYADKPDTSISDEFNASELDTNKWAYRTYGDGWFAGPEYVKFLTEGEDKFVSIQGKWEGRKVSGISTKTESHFGFFTIRWRTDGIPHNKNTPWHPAIWMAAQNFATGKDRRTIANAEKNLEIDFVEYWNDPIWQCQTIAWDRTKKSEKILTQKLRPGKNDFPTRETGWQEHGLEYTPEYLQLWQLSDGKWKEIGKRVKFNDRDNSEDTLNRVHATPGFWILSNKDHFDEIQKLWKFRDKKDFTGFEFSDSALEVDYFRFFPLKAKP